jgi:hypothetical protein
MASQLQASVRHSPLALEVAGRRYGHDERQRMKIKIEAAPEPYMEIDEIVANATETERKRLLDYINYQDALALVETEMDDNPSPII